MSECMQYLLNSAVPRGNCGIDVDEVREKYPDFVDSEQYIEFLIDKISAAAVEAWKKRADGSFAYGQGNAVVGECRRMVMKDKGGLMYTQENDPAMLNVEGHVDHNVNIIATYDVQGSLTGIVVNVACPAQAGEALSVISADFWDDVRKETSRRFGENVYVLPQCSAAGDQSPHLLLRRRADARMMCLRGQLSKPLERWEWGRRVYDAEYASARCKELGRRIADAIEDVLPLIADTRCSEPEFICSCREIQLSGRIITKQEADEARENADKLEAVCKAENIPYDGMVPWYRGVVQRYENQTPKTPMELHVVRLGDIVFATNTFELYLDYGDRIKGQSKAMQTFLIQLAAGMGTYLPSQRSTGGYGSVPASSLVTFSGGDELVEETLKDINALF